MDVEIGRGLRTTPTGVSLGAVQMAPRSTRRPIRSSPQGILDLRGKWCVFRHESLHRTDDGGAADLYLSEEERVRVSHEQKISEIADAILVITDFKEEEVWLIRTPGTKTVLKP